MWIYRIQVDVQTIRVTHIAISPDGRKVSLTLGDLKPGYIYELKLENVKSTKGRPLVINLFVIRSIIDNRLMIIVSPAYARRSADRRRRVRRSLGGGGSRRFTQN